jgi:hypothetical protein
VAAAIIIVVVTAAVGGTLAAINSGNKADEEKKTAVVDYTARVEATLGEVTQPASSMAAFPADPSDRELEALPDAVVTWRNGLRSAQNGSGDLGPPAELRNVNILFVESIIEYLSAVETFDALARVKGDTQDDGALRVRLSRQAADDRNRATSLWTTGVALLDEEREELGLEASGIGNPLLGGPPG